MNIRIPVKWYASFVLRFDSFSKDNRTSDLIWCYAVWYTSTDDILYCVNVCIVTRVNSAGWLLAADHVGGSHDFWSLVRNCLSAHYISGCTDSLILVHLFSYSTSTSPTSFTIPFHYISPMLFLPSVWTTDSCTAPAVPPPFRHGKSAVCGSYPLVTPY